MGTIMNQIHNTVEKIMAEAPNKKVILFPFGEGGRLVKSILNNCYGINDILIIDNYYSKYNDRIKPIGYLKTIKREQHVMLYTCMSICNDSLYEELKGCFDEKNIYIVFSQILSEEKEGQKTDVKYTKCGKYSYGPLCNHPLVESVGAFCSFAAQTDVVLNHPLDYISTHPFLYYDSAVELGAVEKKYMECKDEPWYFDGITPSGQMKNARKIKIGNDVWLGRGVTITNGSDIGNGVIAGAGAVITKPVPDYAIVVGVPAKIIRYRYTDEQIRVLNEMKWWDWPDEKIRMYHADFFLKATEFIKKHGKNFDFI